MATQLIDPPGPTEALAQSTLSCVPYKALSKEIQKKALYKGILHHQYVFGCFFLLVRLHHTGNSSETGRVDSHGSTRLNAVGIPFVGAHSIAYLQLQLCLCGPRHTCLSNIIYSRTVVH